MAKRISTVRIKIRKGAGRIFHRHSVIDPRERRIESDFNGMAGHPALDKSFIQSVPEFMSSHSLMVLIIHGSPDESIEQD